MTQRSTKIFAENMEIVEVFDGIIEGAEFSTFSRKSSVFIFDFVKIVNSLISNKVRKTLRARKISLLLHFTPNPLRKLTLDI